MENNKYYLEKLPVVILIATLAGLLLVFIPMLFPQIGGDNQANFFYGFTFLYDISFYLSLGLVTRKWQQALACLGVALLLYVAGIVFIYKKEYNIGVYLYSFITTIGPLVLFLVLAYNRPNRLFIPFLLLFICFKSAYPNLFFADEGSVDFIFFEADAGSAWIKLITFLSAVIPLVLQLLLFCEAINYVNEKTSGWKPRLLNLGNNYPKNAAVILQIVLNAGLFIVLLNGANLIRGNTFFNSYIKDYPDKVKITYLVQDISRSLSYLFYIAMYGWYYRKFLLEYFVSYNHTSRLLYWFCYLPVIGIFVFLVIHSSAAEQKTHYHKQVSLSQLAGSSGNSVAAILIILALVRLAWATTSGVGILTVSSVISTLLLVWLIADKSGFFANLYLSIASLAGLAIYSFFIERNAAKPLAIMYALVALNTIMLMMLFPALHIREFEYIPDKDPDEGIKEGGDLFPEYSPFR